MRRKGTKETERERGNRVQFCIKMPHNHEMAAVAMADKLSGIEEESDLYEGFASHVETSEIKMLDLTTMTKATGELRIFFL